MSLALNPTYLRCEYLVDPLGVESRNPRLSWVLEADQRGQRQVAYQVRVASSLERLVAGHPDLWDSGRVDSSESAHVVYTGLMLESGVRCWWSVRVWGEIGTYSESAPSWWEMGLLESADWRAQWIGLPLVTRDSLQPSPYLRTTLRIARPVERARIYATARGVYELHLDGQRVGDAILAPGWTDYRKRIQYQTYDVTDWLSPGEHALGAILGTGWYCGYIGYKGGSQHYGSQPQLLLQLQITYTDGSTELIVTDSGWKGAVGPIVFSDMLMGETYDAQRELAGWDAPGFDDSGWAQVAVQARDDTPLVADYSEPVRVTQELMPKAILQLRPNVHVVDMGQNIVGWVRLAVAGESGVRVQMRFAEMLNPDRTIYTANLRSAQQTDTYILKGRGREVFAPHFTFHGFRYIEVTDYPGELTLDAIVGCVAHSDTPPAGVFTCSSTLVNQLYHNIVWGQRGNFLSVPTDCPQRDERLGWLGDAQIFIRTASYSMDVAAFFTKWMQDVADAQSEAGAFPNVAPRLVSLRDGAPAWGDAGIIVPWTIYQQYGDTRIIERYWDAMVRWMQYLHAANPTLIWLERRGGDYGDWLAINAATPKEVLATAYWAYDARLMAQLARAIGRAEEAVHYDALFEQIKAAFNRAFVTADGRVAGDTQTCYVLALHMDLLPSELRQAAAEHLVADIVAKGWHLSTGFVGVGYLLPVLTNAGHTDVAYRLLLNETFPSWGYSIRQGATTIWERWDGWTEERGFQDPRMNSFNHYALGSVGQWLYQYVAGIDVAASQPGFEQISIRPWPGKALASARAEYRSIRGLIVSEWAARADSFTLHVTIPANTTAIVYIPASEGAQLTESDLPVAEAAGVQLLRMEDRCVVCAIESGSYRFKVTHS